MAHETAARFSDGKKMQHPSMREADGCNTEGKIHLRIFDHLWKSCESFGQKNPPIVLIGCHHTSSFKMAKSSMMEEFGLSETDILVVRALYFQTLS